MTIAELVENELVMVGQPMCRRGEGFADNLAIDKGSITGRAVPYDRTIQLADGVFERFEQGAFTRQLKDPGRIKICIEHGQVVGKVDTLTETDGLDFEARVSQNPSIAEAQRALALLEEDLIDEMSIGFATVKGGTRIERDEQGVTYVHTRARLMEISLVPWGAYGRDATLRTRLLDPAVALRQARIDAALKWLEEWKSRT